MRRGTQGRVSGLSHSAFQKLIESLSSNGTLPRRILGQSMDCVPFLQKKPLTQAEDASEEIRVGQGQRWGVGEAKKC